MSFALPLPLLLTSSDGGPWCPRPETNPHLVQPMVAQAMVALTEFTLGNGATRLVPRSHLTGVEPTTVRPEDEARMICPAGSVLVYDGGVIHGGGAVDDGAGEPRFSCQMFFCRSSRKPFCDHTRSIPMELVRKETQLMRRLWGFESQSMWEEQWTEENGGRDFRVIEVEGARPIFDYIRHSKDQHTTVQGGHGLDAKDQLPKL